MTPILQTAIPFDTTPRRLPGVQPMDPADWLIVDDAYAAQMAHRAELLASRRDDVLALLPEGREAADELLEVLLEHLAQRPGHTVTEGAVTRPDGVTVAVDRDDPLGTAGVLAQEDFCLLEKPEGGDEHVLTGAVLCFPAGWTLSQKIGRPLVRIHVPVPAYDDDIAKRVQRLFDGVRVGQPLWRFNHIPHEDPALFHPRLEGTPKYGITGNQAYMRSERQSVVRLPRTRAVVFGIHTFVTVRAIEDGAEDQKGR